MSVKTHSTALSSNKNIPIVDGIRWFRNSEWIDVNVTESDEKFVGLLLIATDDPNAISLSATVSSGQFTVDWGDGSSTESANSTVTLSHVYDYSSISQTPTSLGFKQVLVTITPTVAGALNQINLTLKHSNLSSATSPGVNWAEIKVSGTNVYGYNALGGVSAGTVGAVRFPYLENAEVVKGTIAGNSLNLWFNTGCPNLYRFYYNSITNMNGSEQWNNTFYGCFNLYEFKLITPNDNIIPAQLTNTFYNTYNLKLIPNIKFTSLTAAGSTFYNCYILDSIKEVVIPTGTLNMTSTLFTNCHGIKRLRIVQNSSGTSLLIGQPVGLGLEYVEIILNGNGGTAGNVRCYGPNVKKMRLELNCNNIVADNTCGNMPKLTKIEITGSGIITNATSMFSGDFSLKSIPFFNLNAANVSSMFQNCSNLESIPALNFSAANNTNNMFNNCTQLKTISYSNPVTNTTGTSNNLGIVDCQSLKEVPPFGCYSIALGSATNLSSCTRIRAYGFTQGSNIANAKLNKTYLEEFFENAGKGPAQVLTFTGNPGADTAISRSSTTTTGSTIITIADTSSLVTGMQVTGTGISTARAVTFQDTGDTVTYTAHGLSAGMRVSFSTITTTTGIVTYTMYYVINPTADTFQLSLTSGGSAIALTNNGSGNMLLMTTIVSITPNTSIVVDIPASASGTVTLAYRILKTQIGVMKGWTMTG